MLSRSASTPAISTRPKAFSGAKPPVCGSVFSSFPFVTRCEKKGRRVEPAAPKLWRLVFLLLGAVLGLLLLKLDNAGVGLIGDLGDEQQVVAAEAVGGLPLAFRIAVALREGDFVEGAVLGLIFSNRGLDSTDPNVCGGFLVCHVVCPPSV